MLCIRVDKKKKKYSGSEKEIWIQIGNDFVSVAIEQKVQIYLLFYIYKNLLHSRFFIKYPYNKIQESETGIPIGPAVKKMPVNRQAMPVLKL